MFDQQKGISSKLDLFQSKAFCPSIKNNPFSHYNKRASLCVSLCQRKKYRISNQNYNRCIDELNQLCSPQNLRKHQNINEIYQQILSMKNRKLALMKNPQILRSQTQVKNFNQYKKPYQQIIAKLYTQQINRETNQQVNNIIMPKQESQQFFEKKIVNKLNSVGSKVFFEKSKLKMKEKKRIVSQSCFQKDFQHPKKIIFPYIDENKQQLKNNKSFIYQNKKSIMNSFSILSKQKHKKRSQICNDSLINKAKNPSRLSPWQTLYKEQQKQ